MQHGLTRYGFDMPHGSHQLEPPLSATEAAKSACTNTHIDLGSQIWIDLVGRCWDMLGCVKTQKKVELIKSVRTIGLRHDIGKRVSIAWEAEI